MHLYHAYPDKHEGMLSFMRSKQVQRNMFVTKYIVFSQVSNYTLYRLGKQFGLAEMIQATKFEPTDNWLPPGYFSPTDARPNITQQQVAFEL